MLFPNFGNQCIGSPWFDAIPARYPSQWLVMSAAVSPNCRQSATHSSTALSHACSKYTALLSQSFGSQISNPMWVLFALFPVSGCCPACQPLIVQGRYCTTTRSSTKACTHFSTPGLFHRLYHASAITPGVAVECTMIPCIPCVRFCL